MTLRGLSNTRGRLVPRNRRRQVTCILGTVVSIEKNKKTILVGNKNDELCIKINALDKKIIYKTDFDETYLINTYRTNDDNKIYNMYNDELK